MKIPHEELLAPSAPVSTVEADAPVLALQGTASNLDRIAHFARLEHLWISGVTAQTATIVGRVRNLKRLVIHDWRVPDLVNLATLTGLHDLAIAGSARLRSLAGLEKLIELRRLILFDNCNYDDLTPISGLEHLETLCLEGGFSKPLKVNTLEPLRDLRCLQRLRLASLRVADRSLRPLRSLHSLRDVFIAKSFSASEFRELARLLPEARGEFLDSFRERRD